MNPQDIFESFAGEGELALVEHTIQAVRESYDYRTLQYESALAKLEAQDQELKKLRAKR